MQKIKWLFPLLFLIALGGSAFTSQSQKKAKYTQVNAYYMDNNHYCDYYQYADYFDNCVTDELSYICYENAYWDGTGWAVFYQSGFTTVCYQPYYSYYPNNP